MDVRLANFVSFINKLLLHRHQGRREEYKKMNSVDDSQGFDGTF